jgi:hypothetical protein
MYTLLKLNILNGYAVGVYLSRASLEMHGMKENIVRKAVFRIRIQIVSRFNQVIGSGFGIQIQEGKDDPQKNKQKLRKFMF